MQGRETLEVEQIGIPAPCPNRNQGLGDAVDACPDVPFGSSTVMLYRILRTLYLSRARALLMPSKSDARVRVTACYLVSSAHNWPIVIR